MNEHVWNWWTLQPIMARDSESFKALSVAAGVGLHLFRTSLTFKLCLASACQNPRVLNWALATWDLRCPNWCSIANSESQAKPYLHGMKLSHLATHRAIVDRAVPCKLYCVRDAIQVVPFGTPRSLAFLSAHSFQRSSKTKPQTAASHLSINVKKWWRAGEMQRATVMLCNVAPFNDHGTSIEASGPSLAYSCIFNHPHRSTHAV